MPLLNLFQKVEPSQSLSLLEACWRTLVLGVVRLQQASTASGLAWSSSKGPAAPLPPRTPLQAEAEVERRSLFSYALPFWRWLAGARP